MLIVKWSTNVTGSNYFAFFSLKKEKKGTQNIKRGPKGDPNPQKGPHGDPGPLKGTHWGTVVGLELLGKLKTAEKDNNHFEKE